MHFFDLERNFFGGYAIVAGECPLAVGLAKAIQTRQTNQVVMCYFGDGATNQGVYHEAMNMAGLWKLPIVFICENNLYNEYTHYSETTAGEITSRPKAFGIHTETVDGQDVRAVYETMNRLVERVRSGDGPVFLLCNTYRYHGHHVGDIDRTYYRSREEEQDWKTNRDPLKILSGWIIDQGLADQNIIDQIEAEVKSAVEVGAEFAINAPYPDVSEVDQHVYAE